MDTSSCESLPPPNSTPRRRPSSPPPSSRLILSKRHSHSRSLDTQHDTASRSGKATIAMPTPDSAINRSNKTSRIMSSVKRSLSGSHPVTPKKQLPLETTNAMGLYSTVAERTVQHSVSLKRQDFDASPPSIEQIAMGLHISRTPHLRPPPGPNHPFSQRHVPIPLPPPPSRSAMKKPGQTTSSVPSLDPHSISSTTVTSSNLPPTPRSNRSLRSLTLCMSRLSPSVRYFSPISSSTPQSPTASSGDAAPHLVSPKKAVRFSASSLDLRTDRNEQ
ncbi:hypothetical protein GGU11DRAFT_780555 [Lentinula aff. detonsa]|nr:hypothetical protein GGU11DRAFT_780555 [Lentinula aff. detonsa]